MVPRDPRPEEPGSGQLAASTWRLSHGPPSGALVTLPMGHTAGFCGHSAWWAAGLDEQRKASHQTEVGTIFLAGEAAPRKADSQKQRGGRLGGSVGLASDSWFRPRS